MMDYHITVFDVDSTLKSLRSFFLNPLYFSIYVSLLIIYSQLHLIFKNIDDT